MGFVSKYGEMQLIKQVSRSFYLSNYKKNWLREQSHQKVYEVAVLELSTTCP